VTADPIYQAWAPEDAIWSRWVKPVVFAHLSATVVQSAAAGASDSVLDLSWLPAADGSTALVVDLPGAQSVLVGLSLAVNGYRPVPLFNSVPHPADQGLSGTGPRVVVDMSQVVSLIILGADRLSQLDLAPNAPPAFLLDVQRRGAHASLSPRTFDNRSISLPTDFPSANFLLAQGIRRVVVVQPAFGHPETDLSHTLRRWQQADIEMLVASMIDQTPPHPIDIPAPPRFLHLLYGLLARMGLRRNPLGGYGGFIPEPSSSG
jgi:hypothetical protein